VAVLKHILKFSLLIVIISGEVTVNTQMASPCTLWLHLLLLYRIAHITYIDAVYCYRLCSVVCRSVSQSVCHTSEPCKNSWTDQYVIWVEHSGGPENHVLGGVQIPPWEGQFWGRKGASHCKVYGHSAVNCAKTAEL